MEDTSLNNGHNNSSQKEWNKEYNKYKNNYKNYDRCNNYRFMCEKMYDKNIDFSKISRLALGYLVSNEVIFISTYIASIIGCMAMSPVINSMVLLSPNLNNMMVFASITPIGIVSGSATMTLADKVAPYEKINIVDKEEKTFYTTITKKRGISSWTSILKRLALVCVNITSIYFGMKLMRKIKNNIITDI